MSIYKIREPLLLYSLLLSIFVGLNATSTSYAAWQEAYTTKREDLITESLDRQEHSSLGKRKSEYISKTSDQPALRKHREISPKPPAKTISQPTYTIETREEVINKSLNSFEIAFETSNITYREPNVMKESGQMYGIHATYTHNKSTSTGKMAYDSLLPDEPTLNFYKLDGRYSWGTLNYDSNGTGSMSGVKDQIAEIRALIGYNSKINKFVIASPYIGLGFRYLYDDRRGTTTTGHSGYKREQQYLYLPIGLDTRHDFTKTTSLKLNFEYDLLLRGRNVSHVEDANSAFETLTFTQTRGFGLRTHLNLSAHTEAVDYFIQPFLRYWNINDSDIQPLMANGTIINESVEPHNTSTEYGIQLGLNF